MDDRKCTCEFTQQPSLGSYGRPITMLSALREAEVSVASPPSPASLLGEEIGCRQKEEHRWKALPAIRENINPLIIWATKMYCVHVKGHAQGVQQGTQQEEDMALALMKLAV